MSFEPAILVSPDDDPYPQLVVGVGINGDSLETTIENMKRYMVGMQCPVGLLVTTERLIILKDEYIDDSPRSIVEVSNTPLPEGLAARFQATKHKFGAQSPIRRELEDITQDWLESLTPGTGNQNLPTELRTTLDDLVLPILTDGRPRASHPRWRASA